MALCLLMLSLTDGKQGVDPRDLMPPPPAPGNTFYAPVSGLARPPVIPLFPVK